jgi:flagellar hook-associated protein 3 FlgL
MISGLTPANDQFLASVDTIQTRLNQAQLELSSGLRVNKASDAPQQIGDIFQTRADLANATQAEQNLNLVKTQADAADSALQTAIQLLDNASTLGLEGGGDPSTANPSQQATLASQVQGLISQLVAISRTAVNGVYIFSGDQGASPSYQVNPASPNGVDRLIQTQATAEASDPTGIKFQVAKTAQDLFDKRDSSDNFAPENVFAALQNLQSALQAGNSAGIAQAIDGIHTASAYLNQQLGFYGAAQNRIASAISLAQKFQVQDQSQLSTLQDADVPAAALELTQATTALSAAMSAQAKRPTTSLFDYLPPG